MGVWIETAKWRLDHQLLPVTPFVGVWIETLTDDELINSCPVTPFVGVWIETSAGSESTPPPSGHTLRGCVD